MKNVRILLADDHQIILDGLRTLIETRRDMEIVAEARDGRRAVRQSADHKPDVVIMDISIPELNGIEATRQIVKENPVVKVIALSMHSDKRYVSAMLQAGASGYLLKDNASDELFSAIKYVMTGRTYLSSEITNVVVKDYLSRPADDESSTYTVLSVREREVLQLLAEGKSTKKTASLLYVSIKTVETHRRNIMEKLDLYSIAELTRYAIREGIISP